MRTKTTILSLALILIAAIALCSCNLDATDGIYSKVADSTESTDVTLKAYLGQYNSEHYYLTDEAVCKIGSSDKVFGSGENTVVRGACLLDPENGKFLVLRENTSTLKSSLSYYATPDADAVELGQFNGLLTNGLFFDSTTIYRCNAGATAAIIENVSVQYYLVTGDYAFFSVKDGESNYKFYVIKSDGTKLFDGITGTSTTYVGFQPLPSKKDFILLSYDSSKAKSNLYLLAEGDTEVTTTAYTTLKSSITYAYATQTPSFLYTEDEKTYIVFKCSSYFDKVRVSDDDSDGEVTQISTGFAANLRTADVTNILPLGEDTNIFIAGTVSSMLYEIDMNEDKSTQLK